MAWTHPQTGQVFSEDVPLAEAASLGQAPECCDNTVMTYLTPYPERASRVRRLHEDACQA